MVRLFFFTLAMYDLSLQQRHLQVCVCILCVCMCVASSSLSVDFQVEFLKDIKNKSVLQKQEPEPVLLLS